MNITAQEYNDWYATARGSWTGNTEYAHAKSLLQARAGDSVLDVGCGPGYFTRRFARDGYVMTGIDTDPALLALATSQRVKNEKFRLADAENLPFQDAQFDHSFAITSFCFIQNQIRALSEMRRVTKYRILIGLLNRYSLHYRNKGRRGGVGAYQGAYWHNLSEAFVLFAAAGLTVDRHSSAVFLPGGGIVSRALEHVIPSQLPFGAILFVRADVSKIATGGV